MASLIKLTEVWESFGELQAAKEVIVYVDPYTIMAMREPINKQHTQIWLTNGVRFEVKEMPEQILEILIKLEKKLFIPLDRPFYGPL